MAFQQPTISENLQKIAKIGLNMLIIILFFNNHLFLQKENFKLSRIDKIDF